MRNPLARLPWFISTPAFLTAVLVAAFVANYLGADYFKRTRLDEANPLAGAVVPAGGAAEGTILAASTFRDGEPGHRGSGVAHILRAADGTLTLRVENFSVTNGPDLFVVLSTSGDGYAEGSLNLGALKATDGNFNYEIPPGTDISKYRSAVIWCRRFDTDFAVATFAREADSVPGGNSPAVQAPQATTTAAPPSPMTASPGANSVATTVPTNPTVPASTTAPPIPTATPAGPQVLAQGSFRDGAPGHRGSGTASLGRDTAGKPVLVLANFSVTNGPDLHVILGASPDGGGEGLDLGKLKATDGTFSYSIPDGTDLSQFKSVTIWCASFPTIFAVATLGA